MKNYIKGFVCGIISILILSLAFSAAAETTKQSILVELNKVKIVVNGIMVDKPTILYNGTTYAPLRAVSEILGKKVSYNGMALIDEPNIIDTKSGYTIQILKKLKTPMYYTFIIELHNIKSEKINYDITPLNFKYGRDKVSSATFYNRNVLSKGTLSNDEKIIGIISYAKTADTLSNENRFNWNGISYVFDNILTIEP